jgi:hypothetical protein
MRGLNKIETKSRKMHRIEICFNINKIDKPVARLTKNKIEKAKCKYQTHKMDPHY